MLYLVTCCCVQWIVGPDAVKGFRITGIIRLWTEMKRLDQERIWIGILKGRCIKCILIKPVPLWQISFSWTGVVQLLYFFVPVSDLVAETLSGLRVFTSVSSGYSPSARIIWVIVIAGKADTVPWPSLQMHVNKRSSEQSRSPTASYATWRNWLICLSVSC